jgi:hypothetical protein
MVNSDFRIWGTDRGNYFSETDRIIIFLNQHETLDDLLSTITHECIHFCISVSGEIMDDDQEERIIYIMSWAEQYLA